MIASLLKFFIVSIKLYSYAIGLCRPHIPNYEDHLPIIQFVRMVCDSLPYRFAKVLHQIIKYFIIVHWFGLVDDGKVRNAGQHSCQFFLLTALSIDCKESLTIQQQKINARSFQQRHPYTDRSSRWSHCEPCPEQLIHEITFASGLGAHNAHNHGPFFTFAL